MLQSRDDYSVLHCLSPTSVPNCGGLTRLRGKAILSLFHFGLGLSPVRRRLLAMMHSVTGVPSIPLSVKTAMRRLVLKPSHPRPTSSLIHSSPDELHLEGAGRIGTWTSPAECMLGCREYASLLAPSPACVIHSPGDDTLLWQELAPFMTAGMPLKLDELEEGGDAGMGE